MKTIAQILAVISGPIGAGRPLADGLCVDCSRAFELRGAGLSLITDSGAQGVVGASGALAHRLEELQFDLGEGPGLDASRQRAVVQANLSAPSERWPIFASSAREAGVHGVVALPLQAGEIRLGSLCMYRGTGAPLDVDEEDSALAYAGAAVVVLLHLQEQAGLGGTLHPELSEPVAHRAVVHQATGFLSVSASVGLTEALLLLRAHAFAMELPLLHVAREVLAGRLRILPGEGDNE